MRDDKFVSLTENLLDVRAAQQPARTPGQRKALQLVQPLGLVVPNTTGDFASIRSTVVDFALLVTALEVGGDLAPGSAFMTLGRGRHQPNV